MSDENGLLGGLLSGLLGPSDEELARLRRQYGIPDAEPPSPMVSVGRGAMDIWEPIKQTYLNMADPAQAAQYRAQRAEDERLYQRGLLAGNPQSMKPVEVGRLPNGEAVNVRNPPPDVWRMMGSQAPLTALMLPAMPAGGVEAALSLMLTQNFYDALAAGLRRSGWSK